VGLPYDVKSTPSYYALAHQDIFKDILQKFNSESNNSVIVDIKEQAIVATNVLMKLDKFEICINLQKFKIFQKELKNFGRIFNEEGSSLNIDQIFKYKF
jgi:formiminotetrahydrofolate cyclodeaminase